MRICYKCKINEAGNAYAGSQSAYCADCQPKDTRPQPTRTQSACARCGKVLATLTDFDTHSPGTCLEPDSIGLEPGPPALTWATGADGSAMPVPSSSPVLGTPEGNTKRARARERMLSDPRLRRLSTGADAVTGSDPHTGMGSRPGRSETVVGHADG